MLKYPNHIAIIMDGNGRWAKIRGKSRIEGHLKEKNSVEDNTLKLIAEKADGALRDALSIFDRIYTFCDKNWKHEQVSKILLSLDSDFGLKFIKNLIQKDIPACLLKINGIVENPNSSAPSMAATATSRPVLSWPSVCNLTLPRS